MNNRRAPSVFLFILITAAVLTAPLAKAAQAPDIKIKEVSRFSYVCVAHTGPYTDMDKVIGKLMSTIQSRNVFPTGPMIGVYHNSPEEVKPEELEWEVGFPINTQVNVDEPLQKKVWNFTSVVSAIHRGPYEETGKTITRMLAWMEVKGLVQAGPMLEKYLTMPTPETKPEDLRSEVWIPYQKRE